MKIGIISIHYGLNFGSALQAYAFAFYLKHYTKHSVEVINYIPERYSVRRRYFYTPRYNSIIKKILYNIVTFPYKFIFQHIFDNFLKKNLPLGEKINDIVKANQLYGDYDALIAGSDQIWNNDYNESIDKMYYLVFANEHSVKISYAASCGKDDYTKEDWATIKGYISSFDYISLREYQSVECFKKHQICSSLALDPIFLLNQSEWEKIEKRPRKVFDNYILIYCLDNVEDKLIKIAKKISSKYNLPVVMIAFCHYWNHYDVDYIYRFQGPSNFIWLMRNASFVVTNSFHGVAFAINFEKQFWVCKRQKYNIRLDSILDIMNLKDRYVNSYDEPINYSEIDYFKVNKLKNQYLRNSKDFLYMALGEKCK